MSKPDDDDEDLCAGCNEPLLEDDEIESTPQGSMHAQCAVTHENDNPEEW